MLQNTVKLTLLIVDDNSYEREALRSCINWVLLGIEDVYMAENGLSAWEMCRECVPDIIITDVKMPGMDGIGLIRKLRENACRAKIIFVSAYEDFSYVQSALRQSAFAYILKPVNTQELTEVVRNAVDSVIAEKLDHDERERHYAMIVEMQDAAREKYLRQLLQEKMSLSTRNELYKKMQKVSSVAITPPFGVLAIKYEEISEVALSGILSAVGGECSVFACFRQDSSTTIVVLHGLNTAPEQLEAHITPLLVSADEKMYTTVGLSDLAENVLLLPDLYRQAVQNAEKAHFSGYGRCYRSGILGSEGGEGTSGDLNAFLVRIESMIRAGKSPRLVLDTLRHTLDESVNVTEIKSKFISFIGHLLRDEQVRRVCDYDEEFLSSDNVVQSIIQSEEISLLLDMLLAYLELLAERFAFQKPEKKQEVAHQVKQIIDQEFASDITLKFLSQKIYMSGNYINILFKSVFGYTINNYLTQVRIREAQRLLADTSLSVGQIGEMVGYRNVTYFFVIFKRITNMTPLDWRKMLTGRTKMDEEEVEE